LENAEGVLDDAKVPLHDVIERDDRLWAIRWHNDAAAPFESRAFASAVADKEHPPDPEMRRAALEQGDPQTSQRLSKKTSGTTPLDLQAHRLRQRYRFGHATARTIAALAYAGGGS
jgi:hypothetical protein